MILGETQDLYHLMFGISASLIRLPLKAISLEETRKIRLLFYFMILGRICFVFGQKRKDPPQSVHHVQPKLKEGLIVSCGATSTTSRSILCEDVCDVFDVDLNTTNHEVTEHQAGIVDTSLIPSKESRLPFYLEAPMPRNTQFQLDLLNILSQHRTNLKVHD